MISSVSQCTALHRVGLTDFKDNLSILSTSQLRSIDSEDLAEIDSLLLDPSQPGASYCDNADDKLTMSGPSRLPWGVIVRKCIVILVSSV